MIRKLYFAVALIFTISEASNEKPNFLGDHADKYEGRTHKAC